VKDNKIEESELLAWAESSPDCVSVLCRFGTIDSITVRRRQTQLALEAKSHPLTVRAAHERQHIRFDSHTLSWGQKVAGGTTPGGNNVTNTGGGGGSSPPMGGSPSSNASGFVTARRLSAIPSPSTASNNSNNDNVSRQTSLNNNVLSSLSSSPAATPRLPPLSLPSMSPSPPPLNTVTTNGIMSTPTRPAQSSPPASVSNSNGGATGVKRESKATPRTTILPTPPDSARSVANSNNGIRRIPTFSSPRDSNSNERKMPIMPPSITSPRPGLGTARGSTANTANTGAPAEEHKEATTTNSNNNSGVSTSTSHGESKTAVHSGTPTPPSSQPILPGLNIVPGGERTYDEVLRLKELFERCDSERSGAVGCRELNTALKQYKQQHNNATFFRTLDFYDRPISLKEFISFLYPKLKKNELVVVYSWLDAKPVPNDIIKKIKQIFDQLDEQFSGQVKLAKLIRILAPSTKLAAYIRVEPLKKSETCNLLSLFSAPIHNHPTNLISQYDSIDGDITPIINTFI
jgi:Ca2+-binding EF-hand superfamily protein